MSTLLWIVTIIVAYIIIVCLLIRWINKMTKDSKTIMGSLYEAINTYILNINTTLATQKNSIPKFNDLIEVVYAKKKTISQSCNSSSPWSIWVFYLTQRRHQVSQRVYQSIIDQRTSQPANTTVFFLPLPDKTTTKGIKVLFVTLYSWGMTLICRWWSKTIGSSEISTL